MEGLAYHPFYFGGQVPNVPASFIRQLASDEARILQAFRLPDFNLQFHDLCTASTPDRYELLAFQGWSKDDVLLPVRSVPGCR